MNKKQFTIVLKGNPIKFSEKRIKKVIRQHIKVRLGSTFSRSCYVRLGNGNSKLISHSALGEPQFWWPWPISILQWLFVCSLNVHKFSSSNEEINDKQLLFKDFNKAVNLFLDGVTENCLIQLQGKSE